MIYYPTAYKLKQHHFYVFIRRINDNLEQQAQALFRSWFVDFEPFRGGRFIESELGLIPEGWSIRSAESICEINIGKTPPRKETNWFSTVSQDAKWVSISDMGNCGMFITSTSEYLTWEAIRTYNIIMVPKNTILLSFKLTLGRVAIAECELTTNEAIARFCLPDLVWREFIYMSLKNYNYNSLGSTSSIAIAVNSKIIRNMCLLCPPISIIENFHNIAFPLFEKIRENLIENRNLAELRDTLLPKLMSGKIKM